MIKRKLIERGVYLWGKLLVDTVVNNKDFDTPVDLVERVQQFKSVLMNDILEQRFACSDRPISLGFGMGSGHDKWVMGLIPEEYIPRSMLPAAGHILIKPDYVQCGLFHYLMPNGKWLVSSLNGDRGEIKKLIHHAMSVNELALVVEG